MEHSQPDLRLHILDTVLKSTTNAVILSNRGRNALHSKWYLSALESYGLALIYLSMQAEPTWQIYWPRAVKGFEAAMLAALHIDDLKAFGQDFHERVSRLPALQPEYAAEALYRLIRDYAGTAFIDTHT